MAALAMRGRAAGVQLAHDVAPRRWVNALGIVMFLIAWSMGAVYIADASTLAGPVEVVKAFFRLMREPFAGSTLAGHVLASLGRFASGFALSALIGLPLGLATGWFHTLDAAMRPAFNTLRFVAPIAWVPFAVLWFGTGFGGPVLIIFAGAFPACVIGAYGGAKLVDTKLVEAARMLGARNLRILLEVILPSAIPALVSALRIAAGNAWQSLVGAELIVASSGVAYIMVRGQMNRTIVVVLVGMLTIGLIGLMLEWIFGALEERIRRRLGSAGR
ncbi:MAG: ABC transporter permease [Pseudomonadota bacterium]|nr:ABC transporter permease [Pseudomonadota bacterium]